MWEMPPDLTLATDFAGVFRRVNPADGDVGVVAEVVKYHVNECPFSQKTIIERRRFCDVPLTGERPTSVRHRWDGSVRWISWVCRRRRATALTQRSCHGGERVM
jgi:hypothetical protein